MKKYLFYILITVFIGCSTDSKEEILIEEEEIEEEIPENIYVGDVILKTQSDVDIFGLEGYTKIEGSLIIVWDTSVGDDLLLTLTPLTSLTEISKGRILLSSVQSLANLQGLHNISKAGGVTISNCGGLTNLEGLEGLVIIEDVDNVFDTYYENDKGYVYIGGNTGLRTLTGLNNLVSVPSINISFNYHFGEGLENLNGLESLQTITGSNRYDQDDVLIETRRFIIIGVAGGGPSGGNQYLTDLCALQNLFINGDYDINEVSIEFNAFNPSVQDIIDGNCSL